MTTNAAATPPGLAERKRARTRATIEREGLRLFAAHGFDRVSVEDVCVAAEVSPATFYRYYGTKDEVVFAYRDAFLSALRTAVAEGRDEPRPAAQLRAVLTSFARFLNGQAAALAQRDAIVLGHPRLLARTIAVQRDWESELAAGLATARGADPLDATCQLHAALGLAVLRGAMRRWRSGAAPTLAAATADALAEAASVLSGGEFAAGLA